MSNVSNPAIGGNALFAGLPPEAIEVASERLRTVFFPVGETIFTEGDPGHCLYLVLAGAVRDARPRLKPAEGDALSPRPGVLSALNTDGR